MAWLYLALAGLLEIVWATAMKQSNGFTRLTASLVALLGMIGSFGFLTLAMRTLPLSTAYVLWTGIGAVGAFAVGVVFLGDNLSVARIAAATLIVAGLVTMILAEGHA